MDLCIAGLSYLWEQAKYDPVKRQLTCHISLKNPQTSQVQLSLCSSISRMIITVAGMPLCGTMMFVSFQDCFLSRLSMCAWLAHVELQQA